MNQEKEPTESERKPKPVHQIRYGTVSCAIWGNETKFGTMFNVTASRSYRTKDDDGKEVVADSSSFGRDDLLVLAKALNDAHTWICLQ
jgi:hypothetical protein